MTKKKYPRFTSIDDQNKFLSFCQKLTNKSSQQWNLDDLSILLSENYRTSAQKGSEYDQNWQRAKANLDNLIQSKTNNTKFIVGSLITILLAFTGYYISV